MNTVYRKDQGSEGEMVSRPLAGLAYWREFGDQFRSLGAGRYEVPSRSRKSVRHEVNIERETCSCEDATYAERGRMCAHIFAVAIAISKPAPIPSRERFLFSPGQVMANIERMGK